MHFSIADDLCDCCGGSWCVVQKAEELAGPDFLRADGSHTRNSRWMTFLGRAEAALSKPCLVLSLWIGDDEERAAICGDCFLSLLDGAGRENSGPA